MTRAERRQAERAARRSQTAPVDDLPTVTVHDNDGTATTYAADPTDAFRSYIQALAAGEGSTSAAKTLGAMTCLFIEADTGIRPTLDALTAAAESTTPEEAEHFGLFVPLHQFPDYDTIEMLEAANLMKAYPTLGTGVMLTRNPK